MAKSATWSPTFLSPPRHRHLSLTGRCRPQVFSDHLAALAHKVDWKGLIGDATTRDDPAVPLPPTFLPALGNGRLC